MNGDLLLPIPVAKMLQGSPGGNISKIPDLSLSQRRNTVNLGTPQRTVEDSATVMTTSWTAGTPMGPAELRSSIADRIPFTSPRNNRHHNLPRSNVESIKRAKLQFDARLSAHSTRNSINDGSPRPAEKKDQPKPIADQETREESNDENSPEGNKRRASSVLTLPPSKTARVSNPTTSNAEHVQLDTLAKPQESVVEDSDSDTGAAPNDDGDDVTMFPQRLPTLDADNLTQISKVLRLEGENDYATPERFTEPVARSPQTSQRGRVADTNEATTPLKNLNLVDGEVPEPTINLLLSPNSKPIFSRDYIDKLQTNHRHELEEVEHESNNQKEQILRLSEELSSTNREFLRYDQQIHELKLRNKKLTQNEELLLVQLQHYERELLSTTKALKKQQEKAFKVSHELETVRLTLDEVKAEAETFASEKTNALDRVLELEDQLSQLRSEISELESIRKGLAQSQEALEVNVSQLQQSIETKEGEISKLSQAVAEKNEEAETLSASIKKLEESVSFYNAENEQLTSNIAQLTKENSEIQQINSEQQEHLERVEKIARTEMEKLEQTVTVKDKEISNLQEIKDSLIKQLEESHKAELAKLDDSLIQANESIATLTTSLASSEETVSRAQKDLGAANAQIATLQEARAQLESQIAKLNATNKEKDEIISGDTSKMNELSHKLKQLKEHIASLEKDNDEAHQQEIQQLREHMDHQLELNRQRTAKKIDEVAELLYTQYSKKHESKVGMMRTSFNKKMDTLQEQNNQQKLEIESLRKQLEAAVAEKDLLLELLEDRPSTNRRRLSPKITRK